MLGVFIIIVIVIIIITATPLSRDVSRRFFFAFIPLVHIIIIIVPINIVIFVNHARILRVYRENHYLFSPRCSKQWFSKTESFGGRSEHNKRFRIIYYLCHCATPAVGRVSRADAWIIYKCLYLFILFTHNIGLDDAIFVTPN